MTFKNQPGRIVWKRYALLFLRAFFPTLDIFIHQTSCDRTVFYIKSRCSKKKKFLKNLFIYFFLNNRNAPGFPRAKGGRVRSRFHFHPTDTVYRNSYDLRQNVLRISRSPSAPAAKVVRSLLMFVPLSLFLSRAQVKSYTCSCCYCYILYMAECTLCAVRLRFIVSPVTATCVLASAKKYNAITVTR